MRTRPSNVDVGVVVDFDGGRGEPGSSDGTLARNAARETVREELGGSSVAVAVKVHEHVHVATTKQRGFTLLEVMIGLAILGFSLVVLIQSASGSMNTAIKAQMMGVATDLSRSKMYDIEEKLLKDGFTDTDQSENGRAFDEEGWPQVKYSYKVEQVELPSFDSLQEMTQDRAGSGSAGSAGGGGSFANSALGGMMSQLGGGFGGGGGGSAGIDAKQGASFIQGQYQMVSQVLKVSIRKVTLTVTYPAAGEEETLVTVAFFTDAGAMDKVLSGLGGQDLDDQAGSGSGSGSSGSGRGSGSSGRGSGTTTRPPRGSGGK